MVTGPYRRDNTCLSYFNAGRSKRRIPSQCRCSQRMAGKLSRIQKESGTMRKKITRGTPLILHHLKFSKKENENHQFLLCQKENKKNNRTTILPSQTKFIQAAFSLLLYY